ncbi:MAG: acyl--CoA ligase [Terrimicrobiaceae bacterium]|nr:acyl--CoA ligase [Terrimicrobiaceae bacterium]
MVILVRMGAGGKQFLDEAREVLRGGRPAVLSAGGEVLRTFGEVRERGLACAEEFGRAGLGGQVVILAMENSPEWIEIFYGLLLAGAVPLPCEPPALAEVAAAWGPAGCQPRVVAGKEVLGGIAGGGGMPAPPGAFLLKSTSGITSARRAIVFTAGQFAADIRNVRLGMGISEGDVNLAAVPFSHSYGLTSLVGMLLIGGVPLILAMDPLPRPLAAALGHATVFPGVPAQYRALAAVGRAGGRLRLCISAAAPLAAADAQAFARAWGLKIHAFYGSSECGGICFDSTGELDVPEGYVGSPLPGVEVSEIPAAEGLMIEVRGAAVGSGYQPACESDSLRDGVFRPADILQRSHGGYVVVGRQTDLVNIAGRKVPCARVEGRLRALEGVRDVSVFSLPGPDGSETLAACVVSDLAVAELRKLCGGRFPAWEVPKHWFVVPAIPVDARGKTSRALLRRKYLGHPGLPADGRLSE